MKNRCTNYDKEIECCRILSDWSEAMPVLQPCIESPCKYFKPYTNYDRIKSMSVEEMAEMLIEETEAPLSGEPFLRTPDGELFNEYEEQAKNKAISHTIQWLLQEVEE